MAVELLSPSTTTAAPAAESLLVTGDDRLIELVAPLAAAAGHPLRCVDHPGDAESRWQRAPLVIVGADLAPACLAAGLPARRDLILCTTFAWLGGDTDDTSMLWPLAIQLHADHVVVVPAASDWLTDRFTRTVRDVLPAPVVATVAGHGGAGASTLALAGATAAAREGKRVVLIDLDHAGGGIDAAAGLASQPGFRWPSLANATGLLEPERLLSGLPQRGDLYLVAPDPRNPAEVDAEAFDRVLRAAGLAADLVVVDLPRATTEAAIRAATAARSVAVALGPGTRSWEAARTVTAAYGLHTARLGMVLRGEVGPRPASGTPSDAGRDDGPDLPVWGRVPTDGRIPVRLRQGRLPRGRTGRQLGELMADLSRARERDGDLATAGRARAGAAR